MNKFFDDAGNILYVIGRDFYYASKPYFGAVFIALVCVAIVVWLHGLYAKSLRESLKYLAHELDDASKVKRSPSAMNFLFGVFLVIIILSVFLACEISNSVHEFFLRDGNTINIAVIGVFSAFVLAVFFLWSISLSCQFEAKD